MLYLIPIIIFFILLIMLILIWTTQKLKQTYKILISIISLVLTSMAIVMSIQFIDNHSKNQTTKNHIKTTKVNNIKSNKKSSKKTTQQQKLISRQSKAMLDYTKIQWSPELEKQLKNVDFSKYNFDTKNPKLITNVNDLLVLANKANYFPKDFVPINLVNPKTRYYGGGNRNQMRKIAADALDNLIYQASSQGINIKNVSAYRSIQYQAGLFNNYAKKHGIAAANKFSSKPQFSEHHTGLCADVSSPSMNWLLGKNYINTIEGRWLAQNAHKFGFVIRYPQNKYDIVGYTYEPWHIRYLGIPLASYLHQTNLTFEEFLALQVGKNLEEIRIK